MGYLDKNSDNNFVTYADIPFFLTDGQMHLRQ